MKKIFLLALGFQALLLNTFGQALFSSSFNTLTLQTYTTSSSSTQYTDVPSVFNVIYDTLRNNVGGGSNPNKPFNVPALKHTGWAVLFNAAENDTFLVSTSWLDTTGVGVDRWIITPTVTIGANTVLTWRAKSPDPTYRDGYEVYGTNKLGQLANTDFAIGDRLLSIVDANTPGGGENSSWTRRSINLSAFAGQTLRFAFRNNSINMYQLWIDDIALINVAQNADIAVQSVSADKYVLTNSSNAIQINVSNLGAQDVNSLSMSYQINNSSIDTEIFTFTASALSYSQSTQVPFALPYSLSSPGLYTIKAWINSVNGNGDPNHSNDTATAYVTVLSAAPSRTLLMEQFLNANASISPEGQSFSSAVQTAPAIVVNIHDSDSLKDPSSAAFISEYKTADVTALFDRNNFQGTANVAVGRPAYPNCIAIEAYRLGPANISLSNKSYNPATRELSFTINAGFLGEVKGDYRINAYLTENNVCGPYADTTVNGYNQLNGYYSVSWSQYYQQGYFSPTAGTYVIDALHYKHQNTLVHMFDGAYGLPGVIPSTGGTSGQTFSKTFTLTLPAAPANIHKFNPDNIYIVGFIAEYNADKTKRFVINAMQEKLTSNPEFVGIEEAKADGLLSVYPNPSNTGIFYVSGKSSDAYELKVYDLFGKCLKIESGQKAGTIDLSQLADGMYVLSLRSGKGIMTQKVIIQKN